MTTIKYLKAVRTRFRNTIEKEIHNAKGILSSGIERSSDPILVNKAFNCSEMLKIYSEKLEIQSGKLASVLEEEGKDINTVIEEDDVLCSTARSYYLELTSFKERLVDNLKKEEKSVQENEFSTQIVQLQREMKDIILSQNQVLQEQARNKQGECSVKLPKLELHSFSGEKTKWNEFWDSFESSIHKNAKLSNIEKFNYLLSKVNGEAKRALSGLSLTSENYDLAIRTLEERFGNKQDVIDIHYNKIINILPASQKTSSLRDFLDNFNKHIRSLEVLKQDVNQDLFVSIIKSKLPEQVLLQLEIQKGSRVKWTVQTLCEKLNDYVIAREKACVSECKTSEGEKSDSQRNKFDSKNGKGSHANFKRNEKYTSNPSSSVDALLSTSSKSQYPTSGSYFDKCRYCGSKHWSDECQTFQTIEERKQQLKGSCFKCLRKGHLSSACKKNKTCVYCQKTNSHHRSLCPTKFKLKNTGTYLVDGEISLNSGDSNSQRNDVENNQEMDMKQEQENALLASGETVVMQTAKCEIKNPKECISEETRILFDCGSQRTYISQRLATKLKLRSGEEEHLKVMTFGCNKAKIVKTINTNVEIKLKNGHFFSIVATIVPVISGSLTRSKLDKASMTQLLKFVNNIILADDLPYESESTNIDFLIGNDYYLDLVMAQRIAVQPGLYLLSSKLGWIVTGRTKEDSEEVCETGMLILSNSSSKRAIDFEAVRPADSSLLNPDLSDFWNLESIGIVNQSSTDDEIAMKMFNESLVFEQGRYFVKWPWKDDIPDLPDNRNLAMCRLKSNVVRLRKKGILLQYDSIIQDQLSKQIIEKVEGHDRHGLVHYIPHHAVITPQKTTTKVRIVYDASSKQKSDVKSLNECLFRGPVLLQNLCGMLIRFRLFKIAIIADIEKAFLQVGLQTSERNVTRFLWLKDCDNPSLQHSNIQEYRFCRVPFGVISSPFLLGATINSHLMKYDTPCAEQVRNDIYVDNLVTGSNSVEGALTIYTETKKMFEEASMNIREWITSEKDVNDLIPENDKIGMDSTKVLGHVWDIKNDTLFVKAQETVVFTTSVTKRIVLKKIAEVFDPLGLFSPIIIKGKILIQSLWNKKMKWDDNLEEEDLLKWSEICGDIENVNLCKIPRCIFFESDSKSVEYKLLCFCDASAKAYSTVIYLHQSDGNKSRCDIVFSKSRLAPVKKMTIPRLELLAVVIGVRCLNFLEKESKLPIKQRYLWSDSQCVLQWINSKKDLSVFVKNRVTEIKGSSDVKFGYVPTHENPADIATRGINTQKLVENKLWWQGPDWLGNESESWKEFHPARSEETEKDYSSELKRKTKPCSSLLNTNTPENLEEHASEKSPFSIDSEKYSSIIKLIRVTAWCNRFIMRCRKKMITVSKTLTTDELLSAEQKWIKYSQRKHFHDLFSDILRGKCNNLQRQLGVFIHEDGILRCKGRLENSDLSEGAKNPILLPRSDYITVLIIERIHKQLLHSGVSQTLGKVRQVYWIPQGRATVRQVIRHCVICKRFDGGAYKMPDMAPFPKYRVSQAAPFTIVGLDYLGPIQVKCAGEVRKRWICLFTCSVTRAVHLELVNNMTAEEVLYALRRFISTRGTPVRIISDNASQFRLSSVVIQSVRNKVLHSENVQSYLSNSKIHWSFMTEISPWMGGFYERRVSLVKRPLRKLLLKKLITDVQLHTITKEIEAIINSRPLMYIGDDINSRMNTKSFSFIESKCWYSRN